MGKNVPDCFGEVPPQVGPRPRCPWEDPWVVVGTHRPPTGLFWELTMVLRQATSKTPGSGRSHHMQAVTTAGALCLVTPGPMNRACHSVLLEAAVTVRPPSLGKVTAESNLPYLVCVHVCDR